MILCFLLLLTLIFLDLEWLGSVNINLTAIKDEAENLSNSRFLKNEYQAAWLLKAVTCIDLTTLGGDDTHSNVSRLCHKVCIHLYNIKFYDFIK